MSSIRPEFSLPAPVIFGRGSVKTAGEKVRDLGCKKALVLCDKNIESFGIVKKVTDALDAAGVGFVVWNGVQTDPSDSSVDEAGAVAVSEGVDCLIGVGGGSTLDTAKATAIYMLDPGPSKRYILGHPIFVDTKVPVVLIPTTAGTGSECTAVAIISRPDMNTKWSVFVNTTIGIVDPDLTHALPKSETASTGLDALAHAVEAMTANSWNYHSDLFAEASIKKIWDNLYTAWSEPDNAKARDEMALAANWAGIAFCNPLTHVGHAAADAFSCHFHTAHGLGCALALPETISLIGGVVPDRIRTIANAMSLNPPADEAPEKTARNIADAILGLMRKMEMKSLRGLGYTREQVVALAPDVVENHLSSYCPVEITLEVAEKLLGDIYDTYQ
ncbi:MAG: iron-containing alcohol dehydrogenase [Clostridiales bacterium]|nr:iron-containing alcohol dehydrogenase [Clostridiales bacterium]